MREIWEKSENTTYSLGRKNMFLICRLGATLYKSQEEGGRRMPFHSQNPRGEQDAEANIKISHAFASIQPHHPPFCRGKVFFIKLLSKPHGTAFTFF